MSSSTIVPLEDLIGTRFTLLDSIRDTSFLGTPGSPTTDFGLGITDNPLFFFTTYYEPTSASTPRPYPTKCMWLGSPQGTNDLNDLFGIYVADVVPENFAPGVTPNTGGPSTSWLVNPRLLLSPLQAGTDIVNWFDANYPGGASGGVGSGNSGSNTTYGTLAGGTSAPGNVSRMINAAAASLDGQFWPIYDYVDNSVLLYFSVKTGNCNTLSIYCYKIADSEFGTPATSSEFLGGLLVSGWTNIGKTHDANLLSSHRFSILSPDPLAVQPRLKGTQNAVFMYSYGTIDGVTADHGRVVVGSIVSDIHTNPLNPRIVKQQQSTVNALIGETYYTPDKLGSIFAANAVDAPTPGYVCIYNTPMQIDRRYAGMTVPPGYSSSGVYISSMQLRVMYYNPESGIGFGSEPLRITQSPSVLGTCRPQFTDLPDGKTKIIYANFSWDQYLNLAYEYLRTDALSPARHKKIRLQPAAIGNVTCYTYGKRKMLVRATIRGKNKLNNLSAHQNILQIVGAANADTSNGAPFGMPPYIGSKYVHVTRTLGVSPQSSGNYSVTEFTIEDLDAYTFINQLGIGTAVDLSLYLLDD